MARETTPYGNVGHSRSLRPYLAGVAIALTMLLLAVGCGNGDEAPATRTPLPTATAIPQTALPEELFLEVSEPADESVVTEATVTVRGTTTPDAVVSIDGTTVDVDVNGVFVADVTLVEGPNVIEVVASDLSGAQESAQIAVIYLGAGAQ